jgi:hypothetical protein
MFCDSFQAAMEGLSVGGAMGTDYYSYDLTHNPNLQSPVGSSSSDSFQSGSRQPSMYKQIYGKGHRHMGPAVRAEETHKAADTLNLDEFLAQANAAEMKKIGGGGNR